MNDWQPVVAYVDRAEQPNPTRATTQSSPPLVDNPMRKLGEMRYISQEELADQVDLQRRLVQLLREYGQSS